jgi:hypothetical protein
MVEDTVMAVAALKGAMVGAVGVLVELNSKLDDMLDILSSLADKGMNSFNIVLEAACDQGIILMILDIVRRRVVYSRDTSLRKR